jgi:hypothetical protein
MITAKTVQTTAKIVTVTKQHSPKYARYFLSGTAKSPVYRIMYMQHAYQEQDKNPERPVREVTAAELAVGCEGNLTRAKLSGKLGRQLLFNELPEACKGIVLRDLETYP